MLRQVAISCHKALSSRVKATLARVSRGPFFSQPLGTQPIVPAVQFLTIPLNNHRNTFRRERDRQYSTTTTLPSLQATFQEDYDEWYSHGRVGSVTSVPTEEEIYYNAGDSTIQHVPCGFLLEELKEEESILFDAHLAKDTHLINAEEEFLAFEEGDDDFFDDMDVTEKDYDILDDS